MIPAGACSHDRELYQVRMVDSSLLAPSLQLPPSRCGEAPGVSLGALLFHCESRLWRLPGCVPAFPRRALSTACRRIVPADRYSPQVGGGGGCSPQA